MFSTRKLDPAADPPLTPKPYHLSAVGLTAIQVTVSLPEGFPWPLKPTVHTGAGRNAWRVTALYSSNLLPVIDRISYISTPVSFTFPVK